MRFGQSRGVSIKGIRHTNHDQSSPCIEPLEKRQLLTASVSLGAAVLHREGPPVSVHSQVAVISGSVTGQVTDGTNPVIGAYVRLALSSGGTVGHGRLYVKTDTGGSYTLSSVPDGTYIVTTYAKGYHYHLTRKFCPSYSIRRLDHPERR